MMNRFKLELCLLPLFLFILGAGLEGVEYDRSRPVGLVLSVKGNADLVQPNGDRQALKVATRVYNGDKIETGFKSWVQVEFLDRSKFNLAGSSDLLIQNYLYDGSKKSRSEVRVNDGAISFMAGKIEEVAPENYKIETEVATVGIRGSAGELITSSGRRDGGAPQLAVRKTSGIGLTVSPVGAGAGPTQDIMNTGEGLVMVPGTEVQRQSFKGSLLTVYSERIEGGVGGSNVLSDPKQSGKTPSPRGNAVGIRSRIEGFSPSQWASQLKEDKASLQKVEKESVSDRVQKPTGSGNSGEAGDASEDHSNQP